MTCPNSTDETFKFKFEQAARAREGPGRVRRSPRSAAALPGEGPYTDDTSWSCGTGAAPPWTLAGGAGRPSPCKAAPVRVLARAEQMLLMQPPASTGTMRGEAGLPRRVSPVGGPGTRVRMYMQTPRQS